MLQVLHYLRFYAVVQAVLSVIGHSALQALHHGNKGLLRGKNTQTTQHTKK
jgi:hypothetical protein